MKSKVRLCVLAVLAVCARVPDVSAQTAPPPPQSAPAYGRIAKPKFRPFVSPVGGVAFEYPAGNDWKLLPGQADVIAILAETKSGEAAVVFEHSSLRGALLPDELAVAAESELSTIRARQPDAVDLRQQVMATDTRQVIVVQYRRPGIAGREQVVQYVFPIGTTMFRLICSTGETQFAKYANIFGHIAASLALK